MKYNALGQSTQHGASCTSLPSPRAQHLGPMSNLGVDHQTHIWHIGYFFGYGWHFNVLTSLSSKIYWLGCNYFHCLAMCRYLCEELLARKAIEFLMSLRCYEWRVCGRGQTTSKPSIHRAPSYVLQTTWATLKKKHLWHVKFWQMKNQCLQDERVDCASHQMRYLCGILKVPRGFPKSPTEYPRSRSLTPPPGWHHLLRKSFGWKT